MIEARIGAVLGAIGLIAGEASAGFTTFQDFAAWQDAVGSFATIDFTGFPNDTFITDQYSSWGVTFVDGDDNVVGPSWSAFPEDGWGLDLNESGTLEFSSPVVAFAVHHPGELKIKLFLNGELVYSSPNFPGSGAGYFAGIVASTPFDRALIFDPFDDQLDVDNVYFSVPAPAAGMAVLVGFPAVQRRRGRWGSERRG